MFFRRERPKKLNFQDYLEKARQAGFATEALAGGRVKVRRGNVAAVLQPGPDDVPQVSGRAGIVVGQEIGSLVDGGFQKFFRTPSGEQKPALAEDLKAVHAFQEDLREALGLISLYNEALGTVSNVYMYDRVVDREAPEKKPWEIKL